MKNIWNKVGATGKQSRCIIEFPMVKLYVISFWSDVFLLWHSYIADIYPQLQLIYIESFQVIISNTGAVADLRQKSETNWVSQINNILLNGQIVNICGRNC